MLGVVSPVDQENENRLSGKVDCRFNESCIQIKVSMGNPVDK